LLNGAGGHNVEAWLASMGMSEYCYSFTQNDIDISIVPQLTDHRLKDLGVSLGHRLKMLRAIQELVAPASLIPPHCPMLRCKIWPSDAS
jgi:hypothetical protein